MKNFILSVTIICFFSACHAADDASYTISPYDDDRDHDKVTVLRSNGKNLCAKSSKSPVNPLPIDERLKIWHAQLRKKTPGSPFIKSIENRSFPIVLYIQDELIGYATLFEIAEDFDAIKRHDGYSEIVLVQEKYTAQYRLLFEALLKQCKEVGIKRYINHLLNNAIHELPEYKAMIAAGFIEQKQTDIEKDYNIIRFEKTLQS
jgi:hypothetical protein